MNEKTEDRVKKITVRAMVEKRKQDSRTIRSLTAFCLVLVAGIGYLLKNLCLPGISSVSEGYGSVLLQNSVSSYIVIGILAFILGVAVTILCTKIKGKSNTPMNEKEHIS